MNILIVEDEAVTVKYLKVRLEKYNHTVFMTSNGEEAIDIFNSQKIDFIMMDILLAGELNGIETMELIQDNGDVPFIFMTGYDEDTTRESAWKQNPAAYCVKPLNIEKIAGIIEECTSNDK